MEIRWHNGTIGGRMPFPKEENLLRSQHRAGARRLFGTFAMLPMLALAACNSNNTPATSSAIKIGILSDCQGDFGSFYNDDLGGALAVLAAHYGGKASGSKPSDGMTGAKIAAKDINIVAFGSSHSTAHQPTAKTRPSV